MATEFETVIKELPTLKAPGVSGSRIKKLTDIAIASVSVSTSLPGHTGSTNAQDEAAIIQVLYSNCKAAPSSHKLGTLYVVDSIVRGLLEEAKKNKQAVSADAEPGTYGAAVFKITELIESIVDDAMELQISNSQRTKIGKLVDIWERAETFLPELIARIRDKHFRSTTPPGTPPAVAAEPAKAAGDSGSILLALASLAKTANSNSSTPTTANAVPVDANANNAGDANHANNVLLQLSALAKPQSPAANPAAPVANPGAGNEQQILNMLQLMQSNGGSGGNFGNQFGGGPGMSQNAPNLPNIPNIPNMPGHNPNLPNIPNMGRGRPDDNGYTRRNRSRSPNRGGQIRRERSPPRGYQNMGPNQMGQGPMMNQGMMNQGPMMNQGMGMNQPGNMAFPLGPQSGRMNLAPSGPNHGNHGNHHAPPQEGPLNPGEMNMPGSAHYRPRNVGFDQSLPQGSFKVMSRTLFIGGVPRHMYEQDLANVLRPYAEVQSVILNSERKHAFVKVYSRPEAEQVISSFAKENTMGLRTRWGVGFGPRDCCNYQHGVSVIPIQRLTDADRAWVVQAQWGGTGGQPLLSGMVIDEPDIEIGTGISSKAMSKKMPTNSARNGPKSNRPGEPEDDYAKTTFNGGMSHGATPDFNTFQQSSVNPLSGLFNNGNNQGPPNPGFQGMPQNPMQNGQNGQQNPNLGAQLANFFLNSGGR